MKIIHPQLVGLIPCVKLFKWMSKAYEIAAKGGKHAGFLKNYVGKSKGEIMEAINSLQKRIDEHKAKIARFPNSKSRTHWESEIRTWQEQIDILNELFKKLGSV